MINMEKVRAECKAWTPKSRQVRYYLDDWKQISGINYAWSKFCADVKVWVGAEDCELNIDYCYHDHIRVHVFERVYAHYRDTAVE